MVAMDVVLDRTLYQDLEVIAACSDVSLTDVFRQGLALRVVAHCALKQGRHIGIVGDPQKLDTEIAGIL